MTPRRRLSARIPCFLLAGLATAGALGQTAHIPLHESAVAVNSGAVQNLGTEPRVVFAETVLVPDAVWLQLKFDKVQLAGDIAAGTNSYLIITSLQDGEWQYLNAEHVEQWRYTSAYFNGNAVHIELVAHPGTGENFVALSKVTVGEPLPPGGEKSICGSTDDRILSYDKRACRVMTVGCTGWLIDDCNRCLLTAGHCSPATVMEFNVPLSTSGGQIVHPGPKDQYPVDAASNQGTSGGVGNDWRYLGVFPNSNTGLTPYEAQRGCFELALPPAVGNKNIRITGYGTVSSPVSPTWNQVQKTHVGPYAAFNGTTVQYRTDTTGGNSGSPVIWEETGQAIGIHTHGGCTSSGGQNSGTGYNHSGWQTGMANPKGVCIPTVKLEVTPDDALHGWGAVGGPFVPASITYTLRNAGRTALDYTVTASETWVLLTNATGNISGNSTVTVTASFDAASLPAGLYNATLTFTNVTNHAGDTTRPVVLHAGGPAKAYGWNMDTNPGWTTQGQWAWGAPTGGGGDHGVADPTAGYTGANVYGYSLAGDYANSLGEMHLTSAAIDCSNLTQTWLHFWRRLGVEGAAFDDASVAVSTNGTNWTTLWSNGAKPTVDTEWVFQDIDISAIADGQATVYLRWTMGASDSSWTYCGWNIDDVEIWALGGQPAKPGDLNCDDKVDFYDINPFVLALTGQAAYQQQYPNCRWMNADCNNDGKVDFFDINAFVALLNP